jgi:ATP-dependent Clp protease ATP-binding subunit ClpC
MTSNVGVELIRRDMTLGFAAKRDETKARKQTYEDMKEKMRAKVKETFRPEFLNRLDDIIVFHELTEEHLRSIVELVVRDLQRRLAERKLQIEVSEEAKSWLVKEGYDPAYGVRPLRRIIERYVENPLSTKLLRGEFNIGDTVVVDFKENALTFTVKAPVKAKR